MTETTQTPPLKIQRPNPPRLDPGTGRYVDNGIGTELEVSHRPAHGRDPDLVHLDGGRYGPVYLDEGQVRELRDWLTAWLERT